jgi:hypothetical protein
MLHCLNTTTSSGNLATESCSSDITVFERQRERMKWQQQQQGYFNAAAMFCSSLQQQQQQQVDNSEASSLAADLLPTLQMPTLDVTTSAISRTFSCPPLLPDPKLIHSSIAGKDKHNSSKKRKPEKPHHNPKLKVCACNFA